ncbi:ABC transporter ATP-binding protein [Vibrio genomosp. F10]|uniref:ABC transporter ATP-binding protein n=2 Tax=Vibrio genomosp. F10 TaxID=723171 RepID=A0A1B9QW27_9VIBR|nr:ABC transporter ATP-binding protein [Vibrio genomosp. F10]OCH73523.1 ABC transporter ATP-binding protein [Vibrio genomosp. F10]OEE36543.1 ABC transporter ATP-binding protein [Vibrio genomosp. F10 str. ZF-129]OEE93606.1 ABC transporter ATP-binding protein [Vibrio genomosp. F10 str. 9ZC157]OEF05587.1 ABC transporter ATP-binding protein [Vibrio genomosp. F10 str. 9ZD137]OEF10388.1 ABC transporter ATP-binding protein [Vibrio genomosp. F10 str. 9ZB36]
MIRLEDIQVTFNPGTILENRALRGVNLEVPEHQFLTVIGSNGAGKSTLLGAVTGETPMVGGRVIIDELDVTKKTVDQRAKQCARVFQDPLAGTCADLTIEENMALAYMRGKRRGWNLSLSSNRRKLFQERISILGLGLEDRLSDHIGLLSGGQRQAVSLVMATLSDSKLLLLDEHTAALDPRMAAFVIDLTKTIVREFNLTVMMVTHSMKDALACGDRTVMLHQGEIVLDVSGEQRANMKVPDLLEMFSKVRGEELADDSLLLN